MRIYYHLSQYISHRLSGLEFVECLRRLGHEVLLEPGDLSAADMAVLHEEPGLYEALFSRLPGLGSLRTAAFCVWENETLPEAFMPPLRLVDEIWTPSRFSLHSLRPHFPHARLLPHVVRRIQAAKSDLESMRAILGDGQGCTRFLSIVDAANPRKNLNGLLQAFARARARLGSRVSLVLKQYRHTRDLSSLPGVISLSGELGEGQMAALHILCDAYVSAHHAEGWGLGLSQAMAYGKPVIATGYSGNMDYMDMDNSFPVRYRMIPVSEEMTARQPLFTREMRWAEADSEEFAECMLRVAEKGMPEGMQARAAAICGRFGAGQICALLRELLENPVQARKRNL